MEVEKSEFLKNFVDDVLEGVKKTWKEYGDELDINPETLRSTWRYFKKNHFPKYLWSIGDQMTLEWQEKAAKAIYIRDGGHQDVPSNMKAEWVTQELKDGELVVTKKTFKRDKNDFVQEYLEETVEKYKEIVKQAEIAPYIISQSASNTKTLQIITADKHVGACNKASLFGNEYNSDVYEKRMSKIIKVIDEQFVTYGKFEHLDIIDLGDGVDGFNSQTARGGHHLVQDLTSDEQFDVYVKAHNRLFDNLMRGGYANTYSFIVASNDNHSGVSWMYPCARGTEIYLNAKYPELETLISKDFAFHLERGKHRVICTHGKDEKYMKSGMPIKLDAKAEKFVNAYIDHNSLALGVPFNQEKFYIHLLKGDLHQSAEEYGARFRYKNFMSFFGASDYIEYNYTKGYGYKGFEWQILFNDQPKIIKGSEMFFN